ncbi:Arm DNA-binding domain-containing protein [Burkholderia multivorans]|uniref:Arm DNA-binding domain-containing protein n=1 Tax=Burkholderia multivorans TaxID=87883 RepID=UPI0021593B22|nr:Arm DNA-binding domain-containing protein [Burkholderia multivorans]
MGHKSMLTDKQAKALKPTDKPVFDGKVTVLLLAPTKSGCKWILRFTSPVTRKRRDAGLGSYPEISISEARDKALAMRKLIDNGAEKTRLTTATVSANLPPLPPRLLRSKRQPAKSTKN